MPPKAKASGAAKDKHSSAASSSSGGPPPAQIATVDEKGDVVAVAYPDANLMNQGLCRVSWFSENKVLKGKYLNATQWNALPKSTGLEVVGHNFPSAILLKWLQLAPPEDWNPVEKVNLWFTSYPSLSPSSLPPLFLSEKNVIDTFLN